MTAFRTFAHRRPAVAGLLLMLTPVLAQALDLPPTHQLRPVLIPGYYACLDGTTPTSEFDILDGTAYFLRGATLRAGDFTYDKATSRIEWKSGPFADASVTGYNTTRLADKKPVIVLLFEATGEAPGSEYCTIVE
ncbi:MAG: hypothetical protein KL863_27475 [Rhizobium sp.]|nr:hypothetical protein [Rhizobium sp.]